MTVCDWNPQLCPTLSLYCNALPRASHNQPTTSPGGLSRPIGRVFTCERGGGIALGRGWGDPAATSAKPQPIRPKSLPTLARTLTLDKRMSGHPVPPIFLLAWSISLNLALLGICSVRSLRYHEPQLVRKPLFQLALSPTPQ